MKRWIAPICSAVCIFVSGQMMVRADGPQLRRVLNDLPVTPADGSAAPQLKPSIAWTYTPDATIGAVPTGGIVLHAGPEDLFGNNATVICFSSPAVGVGVASHFWPGFNHAPEEWAVEKVDMTKGRTVGMWEVPGELRVVSVAPSGKRVVLQGTMHRVDNQEQEQNETNRFDVLDMTTTPPTTIASTIPYADNNNMGRGFMMFNTLNGAELLDDEHLLTISGGGRIVCWMLPSMTPVYAFNQPEEFGRQLALSANRKHVITEDMDGIYCFDALTGGAEGTIKFPLTVGMRDTELLENSFSPDGKKLLHKTAQGMTIFNLEKQPQIVAEWTRPTAIGETLGTALWLKGDQLLINSKYLFDLTRQTVTWNYVIPHGQRTMWGGRLVLVAGADMFPTERDAQGRWVDQDVDIVRSYALPGADVTRVLNDVPPRTMYAVLPGDHVTVEVNIPGNDALTQKLTELYTAQLKANGEFVNANAAIKLEVKQITASSKTLTYHNGKTDTDVSAEVETNLLQIAFVSGGKHVWQTTVSNGVPRNITVRPGESADAAVASAQANGVPVVKLPAKVPAMRDVPGFGSTDLTGDFKLQQRGFHLRD
jgi:hypothetical protein